MFSSDVLVVVLVVIMTLVIVIHVKFNIDQAKVFKTRVNKDFNFP